MTDATPQILRPFPFSLRCLTLAVLYCLCGTGCASLPYQYGQFCSYHEGPPGAVEFQYGRPQKTLDRLAWFTGLWSRLLPLNSRINKHELSEESKEKLIAYLEDNDLRDVLVRVNQYDPKGEWRRLRENHRINPAWRYTVGTLSLIEYALIPGRVFGGDQYNAFTNTLYINSDVPAVVLHEAAYAKDIHGQSFPGSYAFVGELPVLSLYRHTKCVNDVLGYTQTNDDWVVERETYRVVYPQMGVRSCAMTGRIVPFWDGILLSIAGAAVGHATGQVAISQRTRERNTDTLEPISATASEPEDESPDQQDADLSTEKIRVTSYESESPIEIHP